MSLKIYLLLYEEEEDSGGREYWNVFYTPCEAFDTVAKRDARKYQILAASPDAEFEERDIDVQ